MREKKLKLSRAEKEDTGILNRRVLICLIVLCAFGLIMVYSASAYTCGTSKKFGENQFYFAKKQLVYIFAGFFGMFLASKINFYKYRGVGFILYLGSLGATVLLRGSMGVNANGATRWLAIGRMQFQVAEVAKLCIILALADFITRCRKSLGSYKLVFYIWGIGGFSAGLIYIISNDLSSAFIILVITFGMSFVATRTVKLHIGAMLAAVFAVWLKVKDVSGRIAEIATSESVRFRDKRIAAWLAPELFNDSTSYQTTQGLYAIGRGGFFGQGLGQSIQKLGAIPEAQNDMIFTIIVEELGVLGAIALLYLYLYLLIQLVRIFFDTKNLYGQMVVLGVFLHISSQVVVNIAVAMNLFPNTGLPLPFVSYGGTAILCTLVEFGVVFSISAKFRENRIRNEKRDT